jgi:hypothetical protein
VSVGLKVTEAFADELRQAALDTSLNRSGFIRRRGPR